MKCRIIKAENIKLEDSELERTNLFLTPYNQSPIGDADMVTIFNGTGQGSTPQEPLALVVKMSDRERSALESDGRGRLASAAGADTRYGAFIQHSPTYLFIMTVGGSVLSTLR